MNGSPNKAIKENLEYRMSQINNNNVASIKK